MVAIFYIKFDFDKTKNGRSVSSVLSCLIVAKTRLDLFGDLSRFSVEVAQIVKFCSSDFTVANDLDFVDSGRVDRERSLDAYAERNSANSYRFANAAVLFCDNDTFESLQTLSRTLDDLDVYFDVVAHGNRGDFALHILFLNCFDNFTHDDYLLFFIVFI